MIKGTGMLWLFKYAWLPAVFLFMATKAYDLEDNLFAVGMLTLMIYAAALAYKRVDADTNYVRTFTKESRLADSLSKLDYRKQNLFEIVATTFEVLPGSKAIARVSRGKVNATLGFVADYLNDREVITPSNGDRPAIYLPAVRNYSGYDRDKVQMIQQILREGSHISEARGNRPARIITTWDECWNSIIPGIPHKNPPNYEQSESLAALELR